jgi:hypothetical protein
MSLEAEFAAMLEVPVGGWTCTRCRRPVGHPGVCDACGAWFDKGREDDQIRDALGTIPERFRWAAFDSPDLVARVAPGSPCRARSAVEDLASKRVGIVLIAGETKRGKTSLACAMMRELATRRHRLARHMRFVSALELARCRVEAGLGRVPAELDAARRASLLVLDDLGQEVTGQDVLREALHARHDRDLPAVVTTHLDADGLARVYGAGTARRLTEHCAWVEV